VDASELPRRMSVNKVDDAWIVILVGMGQGNCGNLTAVPAHQRFSRGPSRPTALEAVNDNPLVWRNPELPPSATIQSPIRQLGPFTQQSTESVRAMLVSLVSDER
ncbi:MAG: hypothetical protein U1E05_03725, partial [Patescibacteria group bacterium]|nr:hypothetical protein [Patescibacteria group bacterium]